MAMNENTKRILLFLAVAFCVFLISVSLVYLLESSENSTLEVEETQEENIELEEEEVVEEEVVEEEQSIYYSDKIKPDFIQKGSLRISLAEAWVEEGNEGDYDVYFKIKGEDMFLDDDESKAAGNFPFRSPLSWNANILYFANELRELFICDSKTDGRFWETTYCINADELDEGYFGQTTRLVYTDESFADIAEVSPIAMTKKERTFVFEVVLPKEFYEDVY